MASSVSAKHNRRIIHDEPGSLSGNDCNSCGSKTYRKRNKIKEISPVSKSSSANSRPTMEVHLRLKPSDNKNRIQKAGNTFTVLTPTTLLVNAAFRCKTFPCKSILSEIRARTFSFKQIFSPETSEVDFFRRCIEPKVKDFLSGKDTTIIAHGTPNSGKTYTLYGTELCDGAIKQSLTYIFDVLNRASHNASIREGNVHSIISESQHETPSNNINITKTKLPENGSTSESPYFPKYNNSIYISCAALYNESLSDLLVADGGNRSRLLKVETNLDGSAYIRNLSSIRVKNVQEVWKVLRLAKECHSTSIYTIHLVKCSSEPLSDEKVSTLTFYDLASPTDSAISPSTQNMKTNQMNNTLVVLRRCLNAIANELSANQNCDQITAPFRECTLTRLLRKPLTRMSTVFIMHIDPHRSNFSKTQIILDLCVTLKKIIKLASSVEVAPGSPNACTTLDTSTSSFLKETPGKSSSSNPLEPRTLEEQDKTGITGIQKVRSQASNTESCYVADKNDFVPYEEFRVLREENDILRMEVNALKEDAVLREFDVRKELVNHYSKVIDELEVSWKKRAQEIEEEGQDLLKWSVNHIEVFYKERIDSLLQKRKRKRSETYDIFEESRTIYEELEAENSEITSKVVVLKETLQKLKIENESISTDKNQCNFELALVKEELNDFQQLALSFISATAFKDEIDENNPKLVDRFKECLESRGPEISSRNFRRAALYRNEYMKATTILMKTELVLEATKKALEKALQELKELKETDFVQDEYEITSKTGNYNPKIPLLQNIDEKVRNALSSHFKEVDTRILKHDFGMPLHVDMELPLHSILAVSAKKVSLVSSESDRKSWTLDVTGSIDHSGFGSRDGSLKEDSGIGTEVEQDVSRRSTSISESIKVQESEEKCTQTCFPDEKKEETLRNKLDDLQDIVSHLKTQYFEEAERVEDLSKELKSVKQSIKDSAEIDDIGDFEFISDVSNYVDRSDLLNSIKYCDPEMLKYSGELKTVECQTDHFDKVFHAWSNGQISEGEDEIINANQLSALQVEFERLSEKCNAEHIPKIAALEEELRKKNFDDVSRFNKIYDKLSQLTSSLENCCIKSDDLKTELQNHLKVKTSKSELVELTSNIQGITDKISSIETICQVINKLCENCYELQQNMAQGVSQLNHFPETDIKPTKKDICKDKFHIGAVEKNDKIANIIFEDNDQEIDRLSSEMLKMDSQLQRFIDNRCATMSKYILLVKQLQSELGHKKDRLHKLEELFLQDSEQFSVGQPSCKGYSCAKGSETGNYSLNVTFENPEPLSDASSARRHETGTETDSDISVDIKENCTCGLGLKKGEGSEKMSGWIKVKRIGGETELVRNAQKQRDNKYSSGSESEGSNRYAFSQRTD